jgi:Uma2 family endonuclease
MQRIIRFSLHQPPAYVRIKKEAQTKGNGKGAFEMSNLAFQEDVWEELLDGKAVAMSPRPAVNHDIVSGNIYRIFGNFLKGKKCAAFGEVDVYLTEKDRVIPDVMIVCDRDIVKANGIYGAPDLIVEVLSPSTASKDRGYKRKLYEKCGVREYWIVSPEAMSIEAHLLQDGKLELADIYTVYPDYLLEKMSEEEIAAIKREFTTSLYPDMTVAVSEVFEGMF